MIERARYEDVEPADGGVLLLTATMAVHARASWTDAQRLYEAERPTWAHHHLEWAETGPTLIAFADASSQRLYRVLRTVKGIGPATALAVLDAGLTIDVLRSAAADEPALLTSVPGLGKARATQALAGLRAAYAGALPIPVAIPVVQWIKERDARVDAGSTPDDAEHELLAQYQP